MRNLPRRNNLVFWVFALLFLLFPSSSHNTKAQAGAYDQKDDKGLPWIEGIVATYYGQGENSLWGGYGNRLFPKTDYFVALPATHDNLPCLGGLMACRIGKCEAAQPELDRLLASGGDYKNLDLPIEFWPGTGPSLGDLYPWVIEGTEGDGLFRVIEIKPTGQEGPIVEAYVGDVGPWCQEDPYWETGSRPDAEDGIDSHGRQTNRAGIDLSWALAQKLGCTGALEVDWRWKTIDGAYVVTRRVTEWR